MSEYYGVSTPNESFIAHYGIKGMKWGVQKAKYKQNDKALTKHYLKAQKKIQKYKDKMNVNKQKEAYGYHHGKFKRSALATAALGSAGAGGMLGALALQNGRLPSGFTKVFTHKDGKTVSTIQPVYDSASDTPKAISAGLGAGLGIAAIGTGIKTGYHAGKAIAAQYRSSPKGHKRAVKKYAPKVEKWQTEMNKSFAGTKYAGKAGATQKKRRR